MLNMFEETLEVTEMRTFKHEPFFTVGGGGGSLFVVLYGIYISKTYHMYPLWAGPCKLLTSEAL